MESEATILSILHALGQRVDSRQERRENADDLLAGLGVLAECFQPRYRCQLASCPDGGMIFDREGSSTVRSLHSAPLMPMPPSTSLTIPLDGRLPDQNVSAGYRNSRCRPAAR